MRERAGLAMAGVPLLLSREMGTSSCGASFTCRLQQPVCLVSSLQLCCRWPGCQALPQTCTLVPVEPRLAEGAFQPGRVSRLAPAPAACSRAVTDRGPGWRAGPRGDTLRCKGSWPRLQTSVDGHQGKQL